MDILVIFTGGTIGSAVQNGCISPDINTKYQLLDMYVKQYGETIKFCTVEPYYTLSEYLNADILNQLIACVKENLNKYDGIIIAHGTDTLQYSAAALSYALGNNCSPVVFVSSAYPLKDEKSNGFANFCGAVEFIKSKTAGGVFISYKNLGECVKIHSALRTVSHLEMFDFVKSIDDLHFASYIEGKIILNPDFGEYKKFKAIENTEFQPTDGILTLSVTPGENYNYSLQNIKAIIIKPYHSGTVNTKSTEFIKFLNDAKNNNVPVFLVGCKGGLSYESACVFAHLPVCVLPYSSFVPIYIKTWLAISNNKNIEPFVAKKIANEFL